MRRLAFTVELLQDAVVSSSSATAGAHASLHYLPGAVFLGAAARSLYGDPESSFVLFHSGRVRFGDARPLAHGRPTLPMPLSLHFEKAKRQRWRGDGRLLDPDLLWNLAVASPDRLEQPNQVRGGHFAAEGHLASLRMSTRLKTAIDPERRAAREHHLFAYEALPAGSRFAFTVELDDDVNSQAADQIVEALVKNPIHIGRSRSAEFGAARVTQVEPFSPLDSIHHDSGRVTLYCVSDLALLDEYTDQPTLRPTAEHFGLSLGSELDLEHSYLRSRRYSPFNATRRRPDLERQVIVRGSVLVFNLPEGFKIGDLVSRLDYGVGAYRETGLGVILVDPAFLSGEKLVLARSERNLGSPAPHAASPSPVADPLIDWAVAQARRVRLEIEGARLARRMAAFLLASMPRNGPGPSQWGLIRETAAQARSVQELARTLFGEDGTSGLLGSGVRSRSWLTRRHKRDTRELLRAAFLNALADEGADRETVVLLGMRLLGAKMPGVLRQRARS